MAACGLDWTVRSNPDDASPVGEGGPDVVADTQLGVDVADATTEMDAPLSPDAQACAVLAADVAAKKKKARECQFGAAGQCTTTVKDECDCDVIIRLQASTPTTDYTKAVSLYVASCGKPPAAQCTCPQLGLPSQWACLVAAPDTRCNP
jgi:hypothetical protein